MSKNGRLEARVKVPAGGWTIRATNTAGGPTSIVLAEGNYYPTALLTALQTALNAGMGAPDFTVSGAFGESGTGRVSISTPSGTFSIQWDGLNGTSTDLRDLLGFTGNLTAVSGTQTGSKAMKGVWLPDSPLAVEDDLTVGRRYTDLRQVRSPTGATYTLVGNSYRRLLNVRWTHVSRDRTLGESATYPMPWEQFLHECHFGSLSYFPPGARVNLYTDATNNTLLAAYHLGGIANGEVRPAVEGWAGRWLVTIPELVEAV